MDFQNVEAAVKDTADSIRKAPAVRRRKNVSYAVVVKAGYEEIQKLREDGYSYDIICKMLSENGVLGTGASPKNFCTAFLREAKRRLVRTQGHSATHEASKPETKKADSVAAASKKAANQNRGEKMDWDKERERLRKGIGNVVNTGLGTIVKHTDGSFDYD